MTVPVSRTPVRIARGLYVDLQAGLWALEEGEICWAEDLNLLYMVEGEGPAARLQAASGVPPVSSVFGRTGAVVAQEGDYRLSQLGDVDVDLATEAQVLTLVNGVWRARTVSIPGALIYRGTLDLTVDAAPASPAVGDLYVNSGDGLAVASWIGLAGTAVLPGQQVAWNGTQWGKVGGASGVLSVQAQQGVVDVGTASGPILELDRPLVDTWYAPFGHVGAGDTAHPLAIAGGPAGFMSGTDKTKLDGIGIGAEPNVQSDWNDADPTSDAFIRNKPVLVDSVFGRTGAVVAMEGDYTLDLLGDVNLSAGPQAAQVLFYSGSAWNAHTLLLDELGDVNLSAAPANGQVLTWNGTAWVAGSATGGVSSVFGRTGAVVAAEGDYTLDQLGDVDLSTTAPLAGQVLTFNGNGWVASDLSISGALVYRGTINLVTDPAPANPAVGDLYVNSGNGNVGASWTGIATTSVAGGEQVAWDGSRWGYLGGGGGAGGGGVQSVSGQNGVEEVGTAADPVLQINRTTVDTWYAPAAHAGAAGAAHPLVTVVDPGFMAPGDKTKLDTIATGAEPNVQADWNETDPAQDSFIRNKPAVPVPPVTSVFGRTGDIVATEGDYSLSQLADVDAQPAVDGQVLTLVGAIWRPQTPKITGALVYRGTVDLTLDTAPGTNNVGDVYVNTGSGTANVSWVNLSGKPVTGGEQVGWDGTKWGFLGGISAGGVQSVTGQNGLSTLGSAADPVLEINRALVDTWYVPAVHAGAGGTAHAEAIAGGAAGFMSGADKSKLDGIAPGAQPGTVLSVGAGAGLNDSGTATAPVLDVGAGTGITVNAGDVAVNRTVIDTWYTPAAHAGAGGAAHAVATASVAGFMSGADKAKLDAATELATPSTLMLRDTNGSVAVNVINATVFNIDALPALP